ncbi:anti-sigma factor [Aliiglaciecola litoralis]|uniref:Anti-sigma factor n=1 Tax=Aliiglaciecola litoralis TaxID=582857 RepID=A0ABN1LDT7_9ALTE
MNYVNQQTTHALAAEYVLGTLRGGARKRFKQLLLEHDSINDAVVQWESYFNGLALKLEPVVPDPIVWQKIQARLDNADDNQSVGDNVVSLSSTKTRFWQGLSGLATAAAIVLAVLLIQPKVIEPQQVQQFTVVQNEQAQPLWLVEVLQQTIEAQATQNVEQRASNDYELWMVPEDGTAPVSLGLLPKRDKVVLAKNELFEQIDIAALAVSLEPLGGSPTGSPTEVLFIAKLAVL